MGLAVLLGVIILGFGISCFVGALALLKIAKNQGKSALYILSVIGLIISSVIIATGAYVIFDFIRYLGTL